MWPVHAAYLFFLLPKKHTSMKKKNVTSSFMQNTLCTLIFMCNILSARGQNLVLNPSFETLTAAGCPPNVSYAKIYDPVHPSTPIDDFTQRVDSHCKSWKAVTYASPDYYHECNTFTNCASSVPLSWYRMAGVPVNCRGYQRVHTYNSGDESSAYTGIYCNLNWCEYIMGSFSHPLEANKLYHIRFQVSCAEMTTRAVRGIGAFVTNSTFTSSRTPLFSGRLVDSLENVVHTNIVSSQFITDTAQWVEISGYYQATGGEDAIIIGYFGENGEDDYITIPSGPNCTSGEYYTSYYFIDDVSVFETSCDDACFVNIQAEGKINTPYGPYVGISCADDSVQLNAYTPCKEYSFEWFPKEGLSNAYIRNPKANPSTWSVTYSVVATCSSCLSACIVKDSIIVGRQAPKPAPFEMLYALETGDTHQPLRSQNYGLTYAGPDCGYVMSGKAQQTIFPDEQCFSLIQTKSNGDLDWAKAYQRDTADAQHFCNGYSVKKFSVKNMADNTWRDGGYVVVGDSKNSSSSTWDAHIFTTDLVGNMLQSKVIGGTKDDQLRDVIITKDHKIAAAGSSRSFSPNSEQGVFMLVCDSALNFTTGNPYDQRLWAQSWYIQDHKIEIHKVIECADSSFIVVGNIDSNIARVRPMGRIFVGGITKNGQFVWAKTYSALTGSHGENGVSAVEVNDSEVVVLANTFTNPLTELEDREVMIIKIKHKNGAWVWSRKITSWPARQDFPYDIKMNKDGTLAILSCSGPSISNPAGSDPGDIVVIHMNAEGNAILGSSNKFFTNDYDEPCYDLLLENDKKIVGGNIRKDRNNFYLARTNSMGTASCSGTQGFDWWPQGVWIDTLEDKYVNIGDGHKVFLPLSPVRSGFLVHIEIANKLSEIPLKVLASTKCSSIGCGDIHYSTITLNGDFGSSVGCGVPSMASDLNPKCLVYPGFTHGDFAIDHSAALVQPYWIATDHTGNGSNIFIADGPLDGNKRAWYQQVPVEEGKNYIFCIWAKNTCQICSVNPSLELRINGAEGEVIAPATTLSFDDGWYNLSGYYTATATGLAELDVMIKGNPDYNGNDFALDDINFYPLDGSGMPRPATRQEIVSGKIHSLFPNPLKHGDILTLAYNADKYISLTLEITDVTGRKIQEFDYPVKTGNNSINIPTDMLIAGTYFLSIRSVQGKETIKFTVTN